MDLIRGATGIDHNYPAVAFHELPSDPGDFQVPLTVPLLDVELLVELIVPRSMIRALQGFFGVDVQHDEVGSPRRELAMDVLKPLEMPLFLLVNQREHPRSVADNVFTTFQSGSHLGGQHRHALWGLLRRRCVR